MTKSFVFFISLMGVVMMSCNDDDTASATGKDINTAEKTSIDRFSSTAGHLMVRTPTNGLPAANAPINFDQAPFITVGLDKLGGTTTYYNFDIQSNEPEDIYVMFKSGASAPMSGQNNIIPTIPGETGYSDFWLVNKVTVPDNYVPNSLTSEDEVLKSGFAVEKTNIVVNCPVVPFGSTALRSKTLGTASALTLGWYKGKAVAYFNFDEANLITNSSGKVPTSPIYVMFNDNQAGPSSGFKTESSNISQTHNVIATSPGDAGYSPLWFVRVIDNQHFNTVSDLTSAQAVSSVAASALVNCPVVK